MELESGLWRTLELNARREREESHQRLERQVRSYMMLTTETVQMLYYLSRVRSELHFSQLLACVN